MRPTRCLSVLFDAHRSCLHIRCCAGCVTVTSLPLFEKKKCVKRMINGLVLLLPATFLYALLGSVLGLALSLIQVSLALVKTFMLQNALAEEKWKAAMKQEDWRGLTLLFSQ